MRQSKCKSGNTEILGGRGGGTYARRGGGGGVTPFISENTFPGFKIFSFGILLTVLNFSVQRRSTYGVLGRRRGEEGTSSPTAPREYTEKNVRTLLSF